jgi:tRNA pseudouridine38-40 synthase
MQRYFIELSYKGTNYHGWQIQPNITSVQEILENALSKKLQEKINIVGAGRTDTGVHAEFFVVHFETNAKITEKTIFSLNSILPNDISVFKIYEVDKNKHARFDAISRTYEYRISRKKNPFLREITSFIPTEFDIDLLNKASEILFEFKDFTSFSKLHTDVKTNNCTITEANWRIEKDIVIFRITADRFLRNMVRAIVGTLLEVNSKKINIENFKEIIIAKDRNKAGTSVSPEGLFLIDIKY